MLFLYRFRNTVATLPSMLVLAVLILAGAQKAANVQPRVDDSLVQIALTELEPPALPTPTPTPAPVTPPEPPKSRPTPVVHQVRPATPPSERPAKTVEAATATPISTANTEVVESKPAVTPPMTPPVTPPPAPAAPPPKPNNASIESEYVAKIRAHLNSIKRYPTGREASQQRPQGKTKVWFVLKRDGTLVDLGIEDSSNSMLLDEAARKTINRATFPTFPESSWAGEATHRFSAELEFIPSAG